MEAFAFTEDEAKGFEITVRLIAKHGPSALSWIAEKADYLTWRLVDFGNPRNELSPSDSRMRDFVNGIGQEVLSFQYGKGALVENTGDYSDFGGHHVHAKSGFKKDVNYDPQKGFSISQEYMAQKGWNHRSMTNCQRAQFKELATSGRPNSMKEHTRIAVEALMKGSATRDEARNLVV